MFVLHEDIGRVEYGVEPLAAPRGYEVEAVAAAQPDLGDGVADPLVRCVYLADGAALGEADEVEELSRTAMRSAASRSG